MKIKPEHFEVIKAVNCHAALMEALELIAGYQASEPYHKNDWKAQVYRSKEIAREALAKAKGE